MQASIINLRKNDGLVVKIRTLCYSSSKLLFICFLFFLLFFIFVPLFCFVYFLFFYFDIRNLS